MLTEAKLWSDELSDCLLAERAVPPEVRVVERGIEETFEERVDLRVIDLFLS